MSDVPETTPQDHSHEPVPPVVTPHKVKNSNGQQPDAAPEPTVFVPATTRAGGGQVELSPDNVAHFQPAKPRLSNEEQAALDEYEKLADDAILDDDEGEAPGDKDEISRPLVVKKLPRFAIFRAHPRTFDLWGISDQQGMDDLLYVTTKSFAPHFEEDVELRRIRFFETVTTDGVIRLVWCMVPEKCGRQSNNNWSTSKLAALEHAQSRWTTMRSRMKLQQYTFRPSSKQHGEPKFSGRSPQQWVSELKKLGMLVDGKDHEFYRKATDSE